MPLSTVKRLEERAPTSKEIKNAAERKQTEKPAASEIGLANVYRGSANSNNSEMCVMYKCQCATNKGAGLHAFHARNGFVVSAIRILVTRFISVINAIVVQSV